MNGIKKGITTSEFWVGLLSIVIVYLNDALGWDMDTKSIISVCAMAIVYIFARSGLKIREDKDRTKIELEKIARK